ncbi:MAG: hypothetical protein RIS75_629 [Actinomycetota bacterium]
MSEVENNEVVEAPTSVALTAPREGLPEVAATHEHLAQVAQAIAKGVGPIAVDAERASGYRYSSRAYLIQLRREGSGSHLIDPIEMTDLNPLAQAMQDAEWILHASTQDLGCLREVGLHPNALFDTEVAGRLLGRERVGLGYLLESELGISLAKEHSAADWSTRPLPEPWLVYAALDVELLIELREILKNELIERDRWQWAEQEFQYLANWHPPQPKPDAWRKTSGIHAVRNPQELAVVRELWIERDRIAREKDKAPGRVLSDAGIIDIAKLPLKSARDIFRLDSLRNRAHKALADHWWEIRSQALAMSGDQLPGPAPKSNNPPPPKAWPDKFPEAAARWDVIRPAVVAKSEDLGIAPEVLISPELIRRVCWDPENNLSDAETLRQWFETQGARPWQAQIAADCVLPAFESMSH